MSTSNQSKRVIGLCSIAALAIIGFEALSDRPPIVDKGGADSTQTEASISSQAVRDDNKPGATESVPVRVASPQGVVADSGKEQLANRFGLKSYGALDEQGKRLVAARVSSELRGKFEELETLDEVRDRALICRIIYDIMKYQAAMEMIEKDIYFTVDAGVMPKKVPSGFDCMVMFSAAQMGSRSVGVVFPYELAAGSDLEAAMRVSRDASDASVDMVVNEFNDLPLAARTARITEMLAAQEAISEAMRDGRLGRIHEAQVRERVGPLLGKKPPLGTYAERDAWRLHRIGSAR